MLVHGAVLRKDFFDANELAAIIRDFRNADLSPEEIAVMSFAQKVIYQAYQEGECDFEELHECGLSDEDILDLILASAVRSFISNALNAVGIKPDIASIDLEPELVQLLVADCYIP